MFFRPPKFFFVNGSTIARQVAPPNTCFRPSINIFKMADSTEVRTRRPLAINLENCEHIPEKKFIATFAATATIQEVYQAYHEPSDVAMYDQTAHSTIGELAFDLTVDDVVSNFKINTVNFRCRRKQTPQDEPSQTTDSATIDAFQILMGGRRCFVQKKSNR